ncbi:MAG TPA: hypothetical protein VMT34_00795, partial [Aggregatilineales bacterium]|nr:hypothetical protein [Aggregatilineales bacterium]
GKSLWNFWNYQYIRVRRCLQCNNLLVFADPDLARQGKRFALIVVVVIALIGLFFAILMPVLMTAGR